MNYTDFDLLESSTVTFSKPPEPVGWWVLPGASGGGYIKFAAYTKPNWLCRFAMRYVFSWNYEDAS